MAIKQKIKISEARIIIFLENAAPNLRFAKMISVRLNIDYGYLLRIISGMIHKEWIFPERRETKIFYSITKNTPTEAAKEIISKEHTTPKEKKQDIEEE